MDLSERKMSTTSSDIKVLVTGISSWIFMSFASLKLSVIYASNPTIAYLITYNISGIIFLLYFYAYLKSKFTNSTFIILFSLFNSGIHLLEYIYCETILVQPPEMDVAMIIVSTITSLIILTITYVTLRKIFKYHKPWNHTSLYSY